MSTLSPAKKRNRPNKKGCRLPEWLPVSPRGHRRQRSTRSANLPDIAVQTGFAGLFGFHNYLKAKFTWSGIFW